MRKGKKAEREKEKRGKRKKGRKKGREIYGASGVFSSGLNVTFGIASGHFRFLATFVFRSLQFLGHFRFQVTAGFRSLHFMSF